MIYFRYAIAAFYVLSAFVTVQSVGKKREPLSGTVAAIIVLFSAATVCALVVR